MHCICVVHFSVTAWNTLEDLQNYSNYSRLYVISNYKHSSVSQTILHQQITKSSPDPVLVKKTWIRILQDAAGVRIRKIQNPVHAHLCCAVANCLQTSSISCSSDAWCDFYYDVYDMMYQIYNQYYDMNGMLLVHFCMYRQCVFKWVDAQGRNQLKFSGGKMIVTCFIYQLKKPLALSKYFCPCMSQWTQCTPQIVVWTIFLVWYARMSLNKMRHKIHTKIMIDAQSKTVTQVSARYRVRK